ncbi:MAG: YbaN family protein [Magnetococcales bacterium]|nr:YbaN family protein [Magnetococcales bacterium]
MLIGNRLYRLLYLILGLLFVGVGGIGIFLPVLPTTPFMIVALWCFSRSSDRFHGWLYGHKLFGPPLRRWQEHRVIPPLAKFAAISAMVASMFYMALFTNISWYAQTAIGTFMAFSSWYILTKPSRVPESAVHDH